VSAASRLQNVVQSLRLNAVLYDLQSHFTTVQFSYALNRARVTDEHACAVLKAEVAAVTQQLQQLGIDTSAVLPSTSTSTAASATDSASNSTSASASAAHLTSSPDLLQPVPTAPNSMGASASVAAATTATAPK
jgi:hypothetical protein